MFKSSVKINGTVQVLVGVLVLLAVVSSNPVLTLSALLFPLLAAKLLWKENEPPILFLGIMLQWLQVSVKVFFADILNVSFESVNSYPGSIVASFYLCQIALLVEAFGIHLVTRKYVCPPLPVLRKQINEYSLGKLTTLYILFSILTPIALRYGPGNAGIQQFLVKFADFKWAIFFIFYLRTFLNNERTFNFYAIIFIEIILGFAGYFSGFKDFFLFVAICYLTVKERLKMSHYLRFTFLALVLFNVMVVWQTVKNDYRAYLSGGRRAQIITVSTSQALNVLLYRISVVGVNDYKNGMRQLVDRISYIDFFSAVMDYVPATIPYENGKLWTEAVTRTVMPRILFPNKPFIDDSERTRKYTGRTFAGSEEGTSISLGYITESYIDFGPWLMFLPLFLFGMLIGRIYTFIVTRTHNQVMGYACAIPLFFQIYTFELALDKAVGALLAFFIVFLVVKAYLVKPTDRSIRVRYETPEHQVDVPSDEYSAGQRVV